MISSGIQHSIFIDPDGVVWTCGRNDSGQLGLRHNLDQHTFCRITGIPSAIQVSAAEHGDHSAILDELGNVWMLGLDSFRFLQNGFDAQQTYVPTKVQNLPKIIAVSCGYDHSIVVDSEGSIWGLGDNQYGQLSSHESVERIREFARINSPYEMRSVVKVRCGYRHSVCQSETNELWGTGNNVCGQLGVGHKSNVWCFQRMLSPLIEGEFKAQMFACGINHTVVLERNGGVWAAGYGCAGQEELSKSNDTLTRIQNIPPMVQIMCGGDGTMMIDANGTVYAFGYSVNGQLGIGLNVQVISPQIVPNLPRIAQGSMSYRFTLLVDDEGGLWASGSNYFGQHGTGEDKESTERFVRVQGIKVNSMIEKRFRNTKRAGENHPF